MAYENPTPVVVGMMRVEGGSTTVLNSTCPVKLIAIRRAIQPKLGELALPGGYVNKLENAETAMAREYYEETGIVTKPGHWRPVKTVVTPNNILLIFMRHIVVMMPEQFEHALAMYAANEDFQLETSELLLVDVGDTLCFPAHHDMLQNKILWE
jgi:ADP-ribose pyrophosphatase YjhB (NUDIX family)